MYAKQFKDEEIAALKSQGMTNKEVAALGCSEKTVQRANVANRQKGHNRKHGQKGHRQTYKTII